MDDKDKLLLTLLRRDARRSIVALARDLNLSRSATQERLGKLQASGAIAGFTLVEGARPEALQSAWLTIRFDGGRRCAQIVPKLRTIPAIGLIHSVAGEVVLIVRVDGGDVAEIERARSAIAEVPGVAEVHTYIVLDRQLG